MQLTGVIEADEVYIMVSHKGRPDIVAQEDRPGEYARDGDGLHEVHVNTLEGFWSLLRCWLRSHPGTSQEKLPWYLGSLSSCIMPDSVASPCFMHSSPHW